jgi:hypothetical protein
MSEKISVTVGDLMRWRSEFQSLADEFEKSGDRDRSNQYVIAASLFSKHLEALDRDFFDHNKLM